MFETALAPDELLTDIEVDLGRRFAPDRAVHHVAVSEFDVVRAQRTREGQEARDENSEAGGAHLVSLVRAPRGVKGAHSPSSRGFETSTGTSAGYGD